MRNKELYEMASAQWTAYAPVQDVLKSLYGAHTMFSYSDEGQEYLGGNPMVAELFSDKEWNWFPQDAAKERNLGNCTHPTGLDSSVV